MTRLIAAVAAFTVLLPWLWKRCWHGALIAIDWEQADMDHDVPELSDEGMERLWADIVSVLGSEVDEDDRGPQ